MTNTVNSFTPTAVLITEDAEFLDGGRTCVDPKLVTPLHLDSDTNSGWLYTREEWAKFQADPFFEPRICRRYGHHEGLQAGERVELLPDMWVVKFDETKYWSDDIRDRATRIFGVYVFDRRKHVHCCSFEATYELHFMGTDWDERPDLTDEEREELFEAIYGADDTDVKYVGVRGVDRMLSEEIHAGFPPKGSAGGYKTEVTAVVTDDAVEELREYNRMCQL